LLIKHIICHDIVGKYMHILLPVMPRVHIWMLQYSHLTFGSVV